MRPDGVGRARRARTGRRRSRARRRASPGPASRPCGRAPWPAGGRPTAGTARRTRARRRTARRWRPSGVVAVHRIAQPPMATTNATASSIDRRDPQRQRSDDEPDRRHARHEPGGRRRRDARHPHRSARRTRPGRPVGGGELHRDGRDHRHQEAPAGQPWCAARTTAGGGSRRATCGGVIAPPTGMRDTTSAATRASTTVTATAGRQPQPIATQTPTASGPTSPIDEPIAVALGQRRRRLAAVPQREPRPARR